MNIDRLRVWVFCTLVFAVVGAGCGNQGELPVGAPTGTNTPTRTPTPTGTPMPTSTSIPTVTSVPLVNERDYCASLRGQQILASDIFASDYICGNFYLWDAQDHLEAGLRAFMAGNKDLPPIMFGFGCLQADNLTTGELGDATCKAFNAGGWLYSDANRRSTWQTTMLPALWSGDQVRVTFRILNLYRKRGDEKVYVGWGDETGAPFGASADPPNPSGGPIPHDTPTALLYEAVFQVL